jgi:hypothetical protein
VHIQLLEEQAVAELRHILQRLLLEGLHLLLVRLLPECLSRLLVAEEECHILTQQEHVVEQLMADQVVVALAVTCRHPKEVFGRMLLQDTVHLL